MKAYFPCFYKVKALAGDTHLGGEDFDNRLVNHFAKVALNFGCQLPYGRKFNFFFSF